MRLKNLIMWDVRCQIKYGFYLLYTFLTLLYLALLFSLPSSWREKAAAVLIFSDPAAMGLFFMGAIVLLEKSQRIPCAFAVSPIKAAEYVAAKVISLGMISLLAAAVLAIFADVAKPWLMIAGATLSAVIFTLLGIIVSTKISSLNQFILWTVPIEIIGFVPPILHLLGVGPDLLRHYPLSACIDMIAGHYPSLWGLAAAILLLIILFPLSLSCIRRMWQCAGGVKL